MKPTSSLTIMTIVALQAESQLKEKEEEDKKDFDIDGARSKESFVYLVILFLSSPPP